MSAFQLLFSPFHYFLFHLCVLNSLSLYFSSAISYFHHPSFNSPSFFFNLYFISTFMSSSTKSLSLHSSILPSNFYNTVPLFQFFFPVYSFYYSFFSVFISFFSPTSSNFPISSLPFFLHFSVSPSTQLFILLFFHFFYFLIL